MQKVKIIKKNRKAQYMIVATVLFGLAFLSFGVCMLLSPIVNYSVDGYSSEIWLRNFFTRELTDELIVEEKGLQVWNLLKWLPFIATESVSGNAVVFLPSKIAIIWIPLAVGGLAVLVMTVRAITHAIGYSPLSKKGIARVVKPIRSYQYTLTLSWFFLVLIFITGFISLASVYPYSAGGFITFNLKGSIIIEAGDSEIYENNIEAWLVGTGLSKKFYWLSLVHFNNAWVKETGIQYIGSSVVKDSTFLKAMWAIVPTLPLLVFLLNNLIGTTCGACSWGTINAVVLASISSVLATNTEVIREVIVPGTEKTSDLAVTRTTELGPQKLTSNLKPKCLDFYTSLADILSKAALTSSPLYKKLKVKLMIIKVSRLNLTEIMKFLRLKVYCVQLLEKIQNLSCYLKKWLIILELKFLDLTNIILTNWLTNITLHTASEIWLRWSK
ncbi:hypothetical protein SCLARK_00963 [Spiroplasma clarkii]|uniref:hypothetical protein n=1 Tax=Spiroplasma clarkii TaxID=2139 RepID=UPI000B57BC9A|nr:hypothetical protein [Spiroplasma clarkii]ARU91568.1 hypothetical protein SCLARK_00963 [Spiroplasma clarkii]